MPHLDWNALLEAENPPLRYKPVKGLPLGRWSGWLDADTGDDLSNSYWAEGGVDYSQDRPVVWVEDEVYKRDWTSAKSRAAQKKVGYLLHPDKWDDIDGLDPALGFLANVNAGGPHKVIGYALEVVWEVPVMLHSKPNKLRNPRGWFQGYGQATAEEEVGVAEILGAHKDVGLGFGPADKPLWPVYRRIWIHAPGDAPPRATIPLD